MKESLFKFLFGDKPIPEETPKALFVNEWREIEKELCQRMAVLIVNMVPKDCCNNAIDRQQMVQSISSYIHWAHHDVLSVLEEKAPKPLRSESDFIHFICEYILTGVKLP